METAVVKEKKGITGSTLKIIAIVAMLIDHIGAVILEALVKSLISGVDNSNPEVMAQTIQLYGKIYSFDLVLRCIGRFGFPIFVFLLIEGFTHTHDIKKYIRNLAIFVLISEIPFNLAIDNKLFSYAHQSVFLTLLIGVLVLTGIKYLAEDKDWAEGLAPLYYVAGIGFGVLVGYLFSISEVNGFLMGLGLDVKGWYFYILGAVIVGIIIAVKGSKLTAKQKNTFTVSAVIISAGVMLAELLNTDYSGWGVFTIVIMYYFKNNYKKRMTYGVLALTIMSLLEAFAFFMVIPATKYNGKRGLNIKYFFYAFYPVHLTILYLIALALGYAGFAIY